MTASLALRHEPAGPRLDVGTLDVNHGEWFRAGDPTAILGVGEIFSYDVIVANRSASTSATGVYLVEALSGDLEFVAASDSGGYERGTHTVAWSLDDLPAGSRRPVRVTVRVATATAVADAIINAAVVETDRGYAEEKACVVPSG